MPRVRRPNLKGIARETGDAARLGGRVPVKVGKGGQKAGKRAVTLAKAATETKELADHLKPPTVTPKPEPADPASAQEANAADTDLRKAAGPVLDRNLDGRR